MIKRIVAVATLVLALMIAIKDGRILSKSGLAGSCSVVQVGADGSELEACRAGKLEGLPDLTRAGCRDAGVSGSYGYWRCPSTVAAGANGR
jgi:hypothetical protein